MHWFGSRWSPQIIRFIRPVQLNKSSEGPVGLLDSQSENW
jgi:hypothetical protein